MMNSIKQLRYDKVFYESCRQTGLDNMKLMSNQSIAMRICNEILPLITEKRNKYSYLKHKNSSIYDAKVIEDPGNE